MYKSLECRDVFTNILMGFTVIGCSIVFKFSVILLIWIENKWFGRY